MQVGARTWSDGAQAWSREVQYQREARLQNVLFNERSLMTLIGQQIQHL
jgi:hypothetical protein